MGNPAATGQQLRDATQKLFATYEVNGITEVDNHLNAKIYTIFKILDASAGVTPTFNGGINLVQFQVTAVNFLPNAAVSANASNYGTLAFGYDNGAGGSVTTVASVNTSTNSWTAGTFVPLTITAANAVIPANSQLKMIITKASSGVALADGVLQVSGYIL